MLESLSPSRVIEGLEIELGRFIKYSIVETNSTPFWIPILLELLNPLQPVYVSTVNQLSKEELRTFYVFPSAVVLYKDEEYAVQSIKDGKLELLSSSGKAITTSMNHYHFRITNDIFLKNYTKWVNSLQVNELVDVCCADTQSMWRIGVIHSIKFNKGYFRSMTVIIDQNANTIFENDSPTIMVTLTKANPNCLSAPFTRLSFFSSSL